MSSNKPVKLVEYKSESPDPGNANNARGLGIENAVREFGRYPGFLAAHVEERRGKSTKSNPWWSVEETVKETPEYERLLNAQRKGKVIIGTNNIHSWLTTEERIKFAEEARAKAAIIADRLADTRLNYLTEPEVARLHAAAASAMNAAAFATKAANAAIAANAAKAAKAVSAKSVNKTPTARAFFDRLPLFFRVSTFKFDPEFINSTFLNRLNYIIHHPDYKNLNDDEIKDVIQQLPEISDSPSSIEQLVRELKNIKEDDPDIVSTLSIILDTLGLHYEGGGRIRRKRTRRRAVRRKTNKANKN